MRHVQPFDSKTGRLVQACWGLRSFGLTAPDFSKNIADKYGSIKSGRFKFPTLVLFKGVSSPWSAINTTQILKQLVISASSPTTLLHWHLNVFFFWNRLGKKEPVARLATVSEITKTRLLELLYQRPSSFLESQESFLGLLSVSNRSLVVSSKTLLSSVSNRSLVLSSKMLLSSVSNRSLVLSRKMLLLQRFLERESAVEVSKIFRVLGVYPRGIQSVDVYEIQDDVFTTKTRRHSASYRQASTRRDFLSLLLQERGEFVRFFASQPMALLSERQEFKLGSGERQSREAGLLELLYQRPSSFLESQESFLGLLSVSNRSLVVSSKTLLSSVSNRSLVVSSKTLLSSVSNRSSVVSSKTLLSSVSNRSLVLSKKMLLLQRFLEQESALEVSKIFRVLGVYPKGIQSVGVYGIQDDVFTTKTRRRSASYRQASTQRDFLSLLLQERGEFVRFFASQPMALLSARQEFGQSTQTQSFLQHRKVVTYYSGDEDAQVYGGEDTQSNFSGARSPARKFFDENQKIYSLLESSNFSYRVFGLPFVFVSPSFIPLSLASPDILTTKFNGQKSHLIHRSSVSEVQQELEYARGKTQFKALSKSDSQTTAMEYLYPKANSSSIASNGNNAVQEQKNVESKNGFTLVKPSDVSPQNLDINRLAEQVYQLIERKIKIERQRRGLL
jgi:hypothetical protein